MPFKSSIAFFYLVAAALWAAAAATDGGEASLLILPVAPVQVKAEGRNALLTCRPMGPAKGLVTGIRWRTPDGREVPQAQPGVLSKPPVYTDNLSADDSLSIIFQSVRSGDEGNYTCEGQVAGGQELSRTVQIRVIKTIRWVDAPQEQFARAGEDFKLTCKVEADPPPTVDWLRDDEPVGERYREETDGLLVPNASPADDGVYLCRAIVIATGEFKERAIRLEVQVPPSFAEAERSATVRADADQTIECHAEGRPPPEYSWVHAASGRDLAQEGGRFKVNALTGALHLSPAHPNDEGKYYCVARNRAAEARQSVVLSVLVAPRVVGVHNATAQHGSPSEVRCEARGRPPPNISWRRHGHTTRFVPGVQPGDLRIATSSRRAGDAHPDRTDGTLSWDEVHRTDDGLYACVAENEAGVAESFVHLTVEFAPSFANTPYSEYWSWDGKLANITCLAESIPNATIRWFYNNRDIEKDKLVMFKKYGEGPQSWLAIDPNYHARYATYKCLAKNKIGEEEHEIILRKAEKPGSIMQVVFDKVTATTIKFKIVGPSNNGGINTKIYNVRYREIDELGAPWMIHSWTADSDYTLTDLKPQTRYEFQFSAQNDVGEGPWGTTETKVMPKRSPPEPPPLLDRPPLSEHPDKPIETPVLSAYPSYFELRWNIPADNGEPILNYIVSWCPARRSSEGYWEQDRQSGSCQEKTLLAHPHTTSYRLQPLQPGTMYMIHLRAINNIGRSRESPLLVKTAPAGGRGGGGAAASGMGASMSSAALVAAVVAALLGALLLLDLACFACRRAGVLAALCERARHKHAHDSSAAAAASAGGLRIGASHPKEPFHEEMRPLTPNIVPSVKRDISVGFDGKTTAVIRNTFVGKDSAV